MLSRAPYKLLDLTPSRSVCPCRTWQLTAPSPCAMLSVIAYAGLKRQVIPRRMLIELLFREFGR
jgi:hypothetical protein